MHSPEATTARHLTAGTVDEVSTGRVVGGAVSINVTGVVELVVAAGAVATCATVGGEVDDVEEASEQAAQTPSNTSANAAARLTSPSLHPGMP
jgi:hypothetical protein